MLLLLLIAFLSGLFTIFAPCIWPILPIVLSSSSGGGHRKPLGVTLGILISFSFLTLSLSYLVRIFNFDPDSLRLVAVLIIAFLGMVLIVPKLSAIVEGATSRLNNIFGGRINSGNGFWGGLFTGVSLGVVWAPCAGPILATIAALSATRAVNSQVILITIVYMIGTGIPLFLFATFGNNLLAKSRRLSPYTGIIQQIFGAIMIFTALLIWSGYDRIVQVKLLNLFPGYTDIIYKIEQSDQVQKELNRLSGRDGVTPPTPKSFLPDMGKSPEIKGITNWLNSSPQTISSLKGKVILVDFWTYSCINCIRTLPFVTGWYEKYKDQGFVVLGIHTPEFEFEKKTGNVEKAIKMFSINYPVAQDNSFTTWNSFNNVYWPAKYLIDRNGHLRMQHNGEGKYEETEKAIQSLLAEDGTPVTTEVLSMPESTPTVRFTPELYLGLNRLQALDSNERPKRGENIFTIPAIINENQFAYEGSWILTGEYGEADKESALNLNFYAGKVFLVITPQGKADLINVFLDGAPVDKTNQGKDVNNGKLILDEARLYEIVDLQGSPGRHTLRLQFNDKGIQVFAFTFGE